MIIINSSFLTSLGITDGNLSATNQYEFYKELTVNGVVVQNQYEFFQNVTVNGINYLNQYEFYKAIGVFYSEPIYDQYTFFQNASFDGVNIIGNQYEYFKIVGSLIYSGPIIPIANFTVDKDVVAIGETVQFTDTSLNVPTSWSWSFGDGNMSSDENPTHTYSTAGDYTVILIASNSEGNDSISRVDLINVGEVPVSSFTVDNASPSIDEVITFTDTSTGSPTAWAWDFGDSTTSTLQNPTHSYGATNSYTVGLTTSNSYGEGSYTTSTIEAYNQDPAFIMTIDTGASKSFKIPVPLEGVFNYDVDFGDGTILTGQSTEIEHTYSTAGTYQIKITGAYPRLHFGRGTMGAERPKLLSIDNWGTQPWESMQGAFFSCVNLTTINATDVPDLSNVTLMDSMFRGCSNLGIVDLSAWNVSNITSTAIMFYGCYKFESDLSAWDIGNVVNPTNMFYQCYKFQSDLSAWDTKSVTNSSNMFNSATLFDSDLSAWDIELNEDMNQMLNGTSMSTTNYSNLLIAWAAKPHKNGVILDANNSKYNSSAISARASLVSDGWTITDGGLE